MKIEQKANWTEIIDELDLNFNPVSIIGKITNEIIKHKYDNLECESLRLINIHQKKVIDRLSRKIQRRNKEFKKLATYYGIEASKKYFMEETINNLLREREKALNYIEKELSWTVGSEELIKILEGKDE